MRIPFEDRMQLHAIANGFTMLLCLVYVGVGTWQFINPWWLWMMAFFPVAFAMSFFLHRLLPEMIGPLIEYFFSDEDIRYLKPIDWAEMAGVVVGLVLCGYVTIEGLASSSMPGYWYGGVFRIYQEQEPIGYWIYQTLAIAGTLTSSWGIVFLLTADRVETTNDC